MSSMKVFGGSIGELYELIDGSVLVSIDAWNMHGRR
jgi:hypothetical protein